MKICLLCYRGNPCCGGQGIYIYYLSRELHDLGHEVHVISGPPYPELASGVTLHKLESLNLYESEDSPWKTFWKTWPRLRSLTDFHEFMSVYLGTFPEPLTFSIRAYGKIKQLLPYHKFDIIHDNQGLGYGLLLMKHLEIPVVATIHHPITVDRDMELAHAENWWKRFRLRRWYSLCTMQGQVSRRLDRIITVSQSSAQDIERSFRIPSHKIRVVYNGIDTDFFRRDGHIDKVPNNVILVNSGEQAIKGIPYLLRALQLLRNGMQVKLTIVGTPKTGGQVLRLIEEYGLDSMVSFTGRITTEELVKYYLAAEIAVVPSLYEGFGLPAAEAMSCSVPVIATRAGALPEVLGQDGETGIMVPPADPDALAAAIKSLLDNEPLRKRIGEAGRKRVETEFNWRQAAKKVLEVYNEVL